MRRIILGLIAALAFAGAAFAQPGPTLPSASYIQYNGIPGVYGLDPTKLPHFRKCAANVRAGNGRCTVAMVGDSTTRSQGAGTGGGGNVLAIPRGYAVGLTQTLNAMGLPAQDNSFFGSIYTASIANAADPRLTLTGTWDNSGSPITYGGVWWHTSTAGDTESFRPTQPVDTFVVYFLMGSTGGSFTININGGSTLFTPSTTNASFVVGSQVVTTTRGLNTINLSNVSGNLWILGIKAYDSTQSAVDILDGGAGGAAVSDWSSVWSSTSWSAYNLLNTYAPDLTVIDLGINDWIASPGTGPSSAWITEYESIITSAQALGDVVLVVPVPSQTSYQFATAANQLAYRNQIIAEGVKFGVPVVDETYRFVSWTSMNALGEVL